jgi:hypothetical protein
MVVDQADQLIDQEGLARAAFMTGRRFFDQPPGHFRAPFVQRAAQ